VTTSDGSVEVLAGNVSAGRSADSAGGSALVFYPQGLVLTGDESALIVAGWSLASGLGLFMERAPV
jgi:hypothetical protein